MPRLILVFLLIFEAFAVFLNRGGGPLLSHIALTGTVFLILCICFVRRAKINFKFSAAHAFYLVFLLWFLISFFWSLTPSYGLNEILLFANAGILLIILPAVSFSEKDINLFLVFLIALAVAATLIGYFIYTEIAFPRFAATFIDLKESFRSTGNDYANFVLLVLPFAFWQALKKHNRITTVVLAILSAAILMSGFLLSFSRAAWFSFIGVGFVVIIVSLRALRLRSGQSPRSNPAPRLLWAKALAVTLKLISIIFLTVVLVSGLQAARSQKFETISIVKKLLFQADEGAASASNRLEFWQGAVQIIKDKPMFGAGVRSFRYLFPKYQKTFGIIEDHPHNIFLKIGVENGLPAALFFAAFLTASAVLIFKFLKKNPTHPILFLSLGALGALAHNLLDFNFVASNFTLFVTFIGTGMSFSRLPSLRASRSNPKTSFIIFVLLFFASLALLALSAHEGYYNAFFKRGRGALIGKKTNTAINLLKTTHEKLFFKRDIVYYLSDAYENKYLETKNKNWRQEKGSLLYMYISGIDAEILSKSAELYFEDKRYNEAKNLAFAAIELDPKNNLKYYYGFLAAQKKQKKPVDENFKQKVLELLSEYKIALAENRKLTILTENPQYALELYGFFGMKKEKDELRQIWLKEMVKFEAKYDNVIPAKAEI